MGTQKENSKVEKAIVEGLEETKKEEAGEEPQNDLEEIMQMVDFTLSKEISDGMRGLFDGTGIYNFPKKSFTGEKVWKECDLMKGGCPLKGKDPHVHIVGVGVQGALKGMRAYGKMHIKNDEPKLADQDGKKFWMAHCSIQDLHNGNELDLWYREAASKVYNGKLTENEFAPLNAQSKCMRNTILAIIPGDLPEKWVDDYRNGKTPFSKERVREYEKEQAAGAKLRDSLGDAPLEQPNPKTVPPLATEFGSENVPENKELDDMTILSDLLGQIEKAESLERLQEIWVTSARAIKKHPAVNTLTRAKDDKKAELLKPKPAGQEPLFPEPPK